MLALDEIADALVVDLRRGGDWMPLFVVLARGRDARRRADEADRARGFASTARRATCPNEVHAIAEIPRTLRGKMLEVPVKRILMGTPPEQAASRESLANPDALDPFVKMARHGS